MLHRNIDRLGTQSREECIWKGRSCHSIASVSLFPLKWLPIQNSGTLDDCLIQGHRATFKLLVQGLSRKPVPWRTLSTSKVSTSAVNNELRCRVIMCYYWFFSFVRLSVMVSQFNWSRSSALWVDHMTICGGFDVPIFLHQLRIMDKSVGSVFDNHSARNYY